MLLKHGTFISSHGRSKKDAGEAAKKYNKVIKNVGKDEQYEAVVRYSVIGEDPRTGRRYYQYAVYVQEKRNAWTTSEIHRSSSSRSIRPTHTSETA